MDVSDCLTVSLPHWQIPGHVLCKEALLFSGVRSSALQVHLIWYLIPVSLSLRPDLVCQGSDT